MKIQKLFNWEKEERKLNGKVLLKTQLIKILKTQLQIIFQIKLIKTCKKYRE